MASKKCFPLNHTGRSLFISCTKCACWIVVALAELCNSLQKTLHLNRTDYQ